MNFHLFLDVMAWVGVAIAGTYFIRGMLNDKPFRVISTIVVVAFFVCWAWIIAG